MKFRERTTATLLIAIFMTSMIIYIAPAMAKKGGTTIQDGTLTYSAGHYLAGQPLKVGYDIFGYNYQAHLYNGYYCNVYLGRATASGPGFPPYGGDDAAYAQRLASEGFTTDPYNTWYWPHRSVQLVMKWNDVWLSNMDRDLDGTLDRPAIVQGSGAWETNHQWGTNPDGSQWNYFCKIVAAPAGAIWMDNNGDGLRTAYVDTWETPGGVLIGQMIWGSYAYIFDVTNDPMFNQHGVQYNPPSPTGFGYYK